MTGRTWAYAGAVLGGAVSVAANVAHSYVPPDRAPTGWTPQPGAVIGAVFWPVALLLAIEILCRVPWPAGWRWVALRFGGLVPVAAVAAVVSYRHMSGLLGSYHEDWLTVRFGPLAVDGLMVMSAGALLALAGISSVTVSAGLGDELAEPTYEPSELAHGTTADGSYEPAWPGSPPSGRALLALAARASGEPAHEPSDEPSDEPTEPPAHEPLRLASVSRPRAARRAGSPKGSRVRCEHCNDMVSPATRKRHRQREREMA